MKSNELVLALQERIGCFGDWPVVMRVDGEDIEIKVIYGDDDNGKIVIADSYF